MTRTFRQRVKRYLPFAGSSLARRTARHVRAAAIRRSSFGREYDAVTHGQRMFEQSLGGQAPATYFLRRSAHCLEKGLISRPRRPLFARDYIAQTATVYRTEVDRLARDGLLSGVDLPTLDWVTDVLGAYFEVVAGDTVTDGARECFQEARRHYLELGHRPGAPPELVPYPSSRREPPQVTYEEFLALSRRRRSVRWFEQRPVSRESMDKAVAAAALAPSACNRQPYEFRIFDDPALVAKVAAVPMGTAGFSDNFPAVVVVIGRQRAYAFDRDRHLIYIDGALAAMSFMYALETMGISSCPINWPDIESLESIMSALLGLERDERVVMLIAVGYADPSGLIPYSQKKALDALRSYNRIA